MSGEDFNKWLAKHLHWSDEKAEELLCNKIAQQFLIAWSLFESKLFEDGVNAGQVERKAKELAQNGKFLESVTKTNEYFQERYEDKTKYNNLKHGCDTELATKSDEIRKKKFVGLEDWEKVSFTIFVVYRYRNNIFHGNKGIESWAKYEVPIGHCLTIMRAALDAILPREKRGGDDSPA